MNKISTLATVILTSFIDISTFLLVFILPIDHGVLKQEVFSFTFGTSLFDLLLWSYLRFCILMGCCVGILCNTRMAIQRIKSTIKLQIYFGCILSLYCIMKIMYFTTDSKMSARAWVMVVLSLVTCITQYGCWTVLGCIECGSNKKSNLSVNVDEDGSVLETISNTGSESENESDDEEENRNHLDKKEAKKYKTLNTVVKLLKLAKDDAFYLLLAFIFLVGCSVGEIFLPYYTGEVVNFIVIEKSEGKFQKAMLYMALITLATGLASGFRGGMFHYVFARYDFRVQSLLFERIMHMEIGFFDVRKTGEITSRLTSDCTKIGDGITYNLNVFLRSIVKVIGCLFFMINLSVRLSIVTLISIPIIAIISELFGDMYRKLSEKVQNSLAFANETAEESISSMRTVRSFAAEDEEVKRYSSRLMKTYNLRKKESVLLCGYRWCTEVADLAMTLLILYYGGHLVMQGNLTGGHLVSFILYSIEIGTAFEDIGDVYTGLMEAVGASKNVLVYIERKPKVQNNGVLSPPSGIIGNVEFKNVSFSYPSRADITVLNDINFSINQGELVALVGPSGGGKSSIVNLLEHFYESTSGQILIDNVDVKLYNHKFIHSKMSLVQQEPVLFARTISENIAYGIDNVDVDLMKNAAVMSNAHDFIELMPKSYATETGERGIQLSGGQKQRIAIARAMIRDPAILILDEATSALDSESEYLVQQAINKNLSGRTVLVIAHRLSTVERADKILVIEKGKIVERGKHNELIEKNGVYAGLVKRQLLGLDDQVKPEADANDPLTSSSSSGSSNSSLSGSPRTTNHRI